MHYLETKKGAVTLVASYFLAVFIIVAQYRSVLDIASYGLLGIYLISFAYFLKNKIIPFYFPLVALVFIYTALESYNLILRGAYILTIVNRSVAPVLMVAAIAVLARVISLRKFIRCYEVVVWFGCLGILYHAFLLMVLGKQVSIINLVPGYDVGDFNRTLDRPLSFFTEPQAFSSFVLPLFGYFLIRKENLKAAGIFLCLIISTSSFGILSGLLVLFFYAIQVSENKARALLGVLAFMAIGVFVGTTSDLGVQAAEKIQNTDFETSIRLSKGFLIFKEFDSREFFFGTTKSTADFILSNLGSFEWALPYVGTEVEELLEYLSSFSYVLVNFGSVGAVLYVLYFSILRKYAISPYGNIVLFMILISNFVNTILFNAWFVFYYAIFFAEYEAVKPKFFSRQL